MTPDDWAWRQQSAEAEAYERAELIQAGQADAAERRRIESAQQIAAEFTAKHPEVERVAPLLLSELANAGPTDDPVAALEKGLRTATAKHEVGAVSLHVAEQSQPFGSTVRASGWLTKGEQFPSAESLAAERSAKIQADAERIYANEQALVGALTAPVPTHAELQQEAADSFTRGRDIWNDGWVKTGQAAMTQRERAADRARNAVVDQAAIISQAQGDRGAAFRAASHESEIVSRTPAPKPEPIPATVTDVNQTRAWWLHSDD
jgi:hypothetical protein